MLFHLTMFIELAVTAEICLIALPKLYLWNIKISGLLNFY